MKLLITIECEFDNPNPEIKEDKQIHDALKEVTNGWSKYTDFVTKSIIVKEIK